jgi:hypothetical protein
MKRGKSQAKKPATAKPKVKSITPARKQAKMAHRPKAQ